MDIILTHEQADFDAAGSVLAAWLLDPSRMPILPKRRNRNLAAFLDDTKSRLPFFTWKTLPKGSIRRIYITDTQNVEPHSRMAGVKDIIVWDHHPQRNIYPDREENIFDPTGACTTFLVEKLMAEKPDLHPGRIYATLMLMGIYEDTGSLSYGSTTPRDIRAAAWLVEKGADLDLMRRYILQPMTDHQQQGMDRLMQTLEIQEIKNERIAIASADIREISDEFSAVAHQLRDMLNPDGLIMLLAVKTGVRIICRSTTDDIDFGAMMRAMNGGGHIRAASGMVPVETMESENAEEVLADVREIVLNLLSDYIQPAKMSLTEQLDTQISSAQLELINKAAEVAEQLDMPLYIVGGVVRDLLQNQPVMDLDLVVEGDATRLGKEIVSEYGGKLTLHPQFFTANWETSDGYSLDLISARSETYSAPAALPTVSMSAIEEDLKRRDFTVNTLAVRLDGEHYGELLDLCGGLQDLRRGLIRTLHPESFIDDPTRIFRAIRFEQRLDFDLEGDTLRQLREHLEGISLLSGQRIWHELRLYCEEPSPEDDFSRIVHLGIAGQIHGALTWNDEIESDFLLFQEMQTESFWEECPELDFDLAEEEGLLWLWISFCPETVIPEICERLSLPKKTRKIIESLRVLRDKMPEIRGSMPSKITFFLERQPFEALYCYAPLCTEAERDILEKFIIDWRKIQPVFDGNDLIEMGIPQGPQIRELLDELRAECIDRAIGPEKQAAWVRERSDE